VPNKAADPGLLRCAAFAPAASLIPGAMSGILQSGVNSKLVTSNLAAAPIPLKILSNIAAIPCVWALLACLFVGPARAEVAVPALSARVTDLTGTLSNEQRAALERTLKHFEEQYTAQIAVLLLPSTAPEAIEQYSMRVVEAWKLGKKGVDNGLLLLVAKNDRKVRIEVGYGLEGIIPDAIARRVIADTITPHFKQGDYAGGIQAGVMQLTALIAGKSQANPAEVQAPPQTSPAALPMPSSALLFNDLTDTFSFEQSQALSGDLTNYEVTNGKHIFVLAVTSTRPETAAQYAARILNTWKETDNLDVDRCVLLLIAKEEGTAHILAGPELQQRIAVGAAENIVSGFIEPQLKQGEFVGAVQTGVREVEKMLDDAARNTGFADRMINAIIGLPFWFLLLLVAIGTGLRWFLGPLAGGLAMGGIAGGGAWFITGAVEIAIAAGLLGFIFVLVGLMNWVAMGFGGGSSGGGGGFSGGGGGFGGGGASGSW
jgi:uncharacterized membrane protein YgcG